MNGDFLSGESKSPESKPDQISWMRRFVAAALLGGAIGGMSAVVLKSVDRQPISHSSIPVEARKSYVEPVQKSAQEPTLEERERLDKALVERMDRALGIRHDP